MQVPMLDLKAQYNTIRDEIKIGLNEVIESQHFILGKAVADLEENVAAYSGSKYGVGVSSGSDALLICLMAEEIGPGDEVITTPYTFFATAGAISRVGATPVFVDIDPVTYNLDPKLIREKITDKTKAIIPVHLYGQCADMSAIMQIAVKHNILVIEDAAQAIGSEYATETSGSLIVKRAGELSDYCCFSFFPSKNLGAFGDGGMVVTTHPEKAEKLKILRSHGSKPKYYHKVVGGNFRLDALQAAVLLVKFRYLDKWSEARRNNAEWYNSAFKETNLIETGLLSLPRPIWHEKLSKEGCRMNNFIQNSGKNYHIYNQYIINTSKRDDLMDHLDKKGIGNTIYYPVPLHLQQCFDYLGCKVGDFPESESAAQKTLALPIYPELSREQLQYVVDSVVEGLDK